MAISLARIGAPLRRARAMVGELKLNMRVRAGQRREHQAVARLGAAIGSAGVQESGELGDLLARIGAGRAKLDQLRAAMVTSLQEDRADFLGASQWMRPVVVLRGLCSRAVLRHQLALCRRSLVAPHQALGRSVFQRGSNWRDIPPELLREVVEARASLRTVSDERARWLAPYGGSALPKWLPKLQKESKELSRAVWEQLSPLILPRSPALVGLAVGWWLADTYTDSHVKSALRSLGIGQGGRRVVSGDTYESMMFWLPVLSAAICAYLVSRAQSVIHQRYSGPAPDISIRQSWSREG